MRNASENEDRPDIENSGQNSDDQHSSIHVSNAENPDNSNSELEDSVLVKTPCCTVRKTLSFTSRVIILLIILAITSLLMYVFNTDHPLARSVVMFVIRNKAAAPFILILLCIVITVFFLPGVFGAMLCGYCYCFVLSHSMVLVVFIGSVTCFVGFSLGSL